MEVIQPQNEFKFDIRSISDSPNSFVALLKVSESLTYFDGHFPEQPTLPAVAIIDASIESLKVAFGITATLMKIKSAKFLMPIGPLTEVTIQVEQEDAYRWIIKWLINEKIAADMSLDISTDLSLGC